MFLYRMAHKSLQIYIPLSKTNYTYLNHFAHILHTY